MCDVKNIKKDLNDIELSLYGKSFIDSANTFIDTNTDYYHVFFNNIDGTEELNDEQIDKIKKQLYCTVKTLARQAYLDGCLYGHNFKENPYSTDEILVDKNFMILYEFHDNDFGNLIEDAATYWCELWNAKVDFINKHLDTVIKDSKEYLDNLEKLENVSRIIANEFCSSNITDKNDYDRYGDENVPLPNELLDNCKKYVEYLDILNLKDYHKGNIEDIEKYTIDKYKDMQDECDKTPFEHLWLNGECLFIKVEHGYATTFVK